VRHIFDF
jgi:hypothetical protein